MGGCISRESAEELEDSIVNFFDGPGDVYERIREEKHDKGPRAIGGPRTMLGSLWTRAPLSPGQEQLEGSTLGCRVHFTTVRLTDGTMVVFGGEGPLGEKLCDVVRSSDGVSWERCGSLPEDIPRAGAAAVVQGRNLFLLGGLVGKRPVADVWRSSDLGTSWEKCATPPWVARAFHCVVALPDGSIWVLGGRAGTTEVLNDVWISEPPFESWQCATASAPWAPRAEHSASVLTGADGIARVLLMGGSGQRPWSDTYFDTSYRSDVWITHDAAEWVRAGNAPWPGRAGHAVMALPKAVNADSEVLLVGGRGAGTTSLGDAWRARIINDVAKWERASFDCGLGNREGFELMLSDGGTTITAFGGRKLRVLNWESTAWFTMPHPWRTSDLELLPDQWMSLAVLGKQLAAAYALPLEEWWMRIVRMVLPSHWIKFATMKREAQQNGREQNGHGPCLGGS